MVLCEIFGYPVQEGLVRPANAGLFVLAENMLHAFRVFERDQQELLGQNCQGTFRIPTIFYTVDFLNSAGFMKADLGLCP